MISIGKYPRAIDILQGAFQEMMSTGVVTASNAKFEEAFFAAYNFRDASDREEQRVDYSFPTPTIQSDRSSGENARQVSQ